MFDKLKKIFSVDDEQYEEEKITNTQTNIDQLLNDYDNNVDNDVNLVEIDSTGKVVVPQIKKSTYSPINVIPTKNPIIDTAEIQTQARNAESLDFRNKDQNTIEKRKLDFGQTIDDIYADDNKETLAKAPVFKENPKPVFKKKEVKTNPDTGYVLRDILSPHGGVVRKETNTIQREKPKEPTKIIRLREDYKVLDLENNEIDNTIDNIDSVFDELTSSLEDNNENTNTSIIMESSPSSNETKLADTSKFTLIEDSTGEMRLFIEEDEE